MPSERQKRNAYGGVWCNRWLWRTKERKEIDYIEECDGTLSAYEFKWSPTAKCRAPKQFLAAYPSATFKVVNRDNAEDFLL